MLLASLILSVVAVPQQGVVAQGISTKDRGAAAQRHFSVLSEHFGLEGFYSLPMSAIIPDGSKVTAKDIWPYLLGTGLPIALNGKMPMASRVEADNLTWDGAHLRDEDGHCFLVDGEMIVDVLNKKGAEVQTGDTLSIDLYVRRYMKEWDAWSDSISLHVSVKGELYRVEINDGGKYQSAYSISNPRKADGQGDRSNSRTPLIYSRP